MINTGHWLKSAFTATLVLAVGTAWSQTVNVYPYPMEPRQHPDDARRSVKPPDQATFKNKLQFIALRSLSQNYMADLDLYTKKDKLGDVVWPSYSVLYEKDAEAMARELKKRGLYLFDIWGFVPGSGTGGWTQFTPPEGVLDMFERELGDRWLGMDNGEQDGRYAGGYAGQIMPYGAGRFEQYLHFQRHFERLGDQLGNKLATLVSLNFGHYFLRENIYTLIGAETAQALPNGQLYYAFIRGAGKQYGVPWFGNASIYNRWGHKRYAPSDPQGGPTKGTSLALLKRLMYSQIAYNCSAVGFEASCYGTNGLSPLGRIQQAAVEWSEKFGAPGIMHTPVAVMVDFYAGWSFPRHLYSPDIYKVWGNLPYDEGDYLTDGVLDMLYPGYQDSSYYHDERGFIAPTPFGDIADCLLSDAPLWLLRQYPVLVLAGRMEPSQEFSDTLTAYVKQGGHLVMTAANARKLFPDGIGGIRVLPEIRTCKTAQGDITLHAFGLTDGAKAIKAPKMREPVAARQALGKGLVTVLSSPYGIAEKPQCGLPAKAGVDAPLDKPYPLLNPVRAVLAQVFQSQMIFGTAKEPANDGLSLITCRRSAGEYTVSVCNNTWEEKPLTLYPYAGKIRQITELQSDASERTAVGFLPEFVTNAVVGSDTATRIAGGSVRLFRVSLDEAKAVEPISFERPSPNPVGRVLALREPCSIKESLLRRPTFFRHYDSVMIDWRYLSSRDKTEIAAQAGWLKRQGLHILVDASSGINLYPDIRLIDNDPKETARSETLLLDVLEKMRLLGSKELVITLHRLPENNMTGAQANDSLRDSCRKWARKAAESGITVYLRQTPKKNMTADFANLNHWISLVHEPNFKALPSLAALLANTGDRAGLLKQIAADPSDSFLVSGFAKDVHNQLSNLHTPLSRSDDQEDVQTAIRLIKAKKCRVVFDACYASVDEEYDDAKRFESLTGDARLP